MIKTILLGGFFRGFCSSVRKSYGFPPCSGRASVSIQSIAEEECHKRLGSASLRKGKCRRLSIAFCLAANGPRSNFPKNQRVPRDWRPQILRETRESFL